MLVQAVNRKEEEPCSAEVKDNLLAACEITTKHFWVHTAYALKAYLDCEVLLD